MPTRTRALSSTALSALLLGLVAAAPPAAATPRHVTPVPLRIASYNIHFGSGMDNVFDLDRQEAALRALDADVIGLQEVDVHWSARSRNLDVARELADRLGMRVSFAPIYSLDPQTAGEPRREFGVAVLSRYPIRSAVNHEITRLSTQDPDPVPAPAPGFGEVTLKVRGVPVQVFVTHLDYRPDPAVRVAQVADTRRIMASERRAAPGARQVLLGDFNAPRSAAELDPLWTELTDAGPAEDGTFPADAPVQRIDYVAVGPLWTELTDAGPAEDGTFPADAPVQRIDYVAVGAGVRVRSAAVPDERAASDHRPLVAEVTLRR